MILYDNAYYNARDAILLLGISLLDEVLKRRPCLERRCGALRDEQRLACGRVPTFSSTSHASLEASKAWDTNFVTCRNRCLDRVEDGIDGHLGVRLCERAVGRDDRHEVLLAQILTCELSSEWSREPARAPGGAIRAREQPMSIIRRTARADMFRLCCWHLGMLCVHIGAVWRQETREPRPSEREFRRNQFIAFLRPFVPVRVRSYLLWHAYGCVYQDSL